MNWSKTNWLRRIFTCKVRIEPIWSSMTRINDQSKLDKLVIRYGSWYNEASNENKSCSHCSHGFGGEVIMMGFWWVIPFLLYT